MSSAAESVDTNYENIGIALLIGSLVCLGTWPALLRLSSYSSSGVSGEGTHKLSLCSRPIQAYGRHPCHAYIDYSIAYVLASMFPILTGLALREAADDVSGSIWIPSLVGVAVMGGTLLSLGNMCMQWATVVFGAPLTTVLALQASMTVVIGTSINYLLQPERTAHIHRLAGGVLFFLFAIGLAARAQVSYAAENGGSSSTTQQATCGGTTNRRLYEYGHCSGDIELESPHDDDKVDVRKNTVSSSQASLPYQPSGFSTTGTNVDYMAHDQHGALAPFAVYDDERHDAHDSWSELSSTHKGLGIAVLGGLALGFFSPAFNIAVNNPFQWSGTGAAGTASQGALSVPAANLWFALAFSFCSIVGNVALTIRYPPDGASQREDTATSGTISSWSMIGSGHQLRWSNVIQEYWYDTAWPERQWAVAAGCLCALGNVLQFQGGKWAGFATSDLVQAFPLVATLWDIWLFGEFRREAATPTKPQSTCWIVHILLMGMYFAYMGGIVLLASSI
jgi:hypothetical protein